MRGRQEHVPRMRAVGREWHGACIIEDLYETLKVTAMEESGCQESVLLVGEMATNQLR